MLIGRMEGGGKELAGFRTIKVCCKCQCVCKIYVQEWMLHDYEAYCASMHGARPGLLDVARTFYDSMIERKF